MILTLSRAWRSKTNEPKWRFAHSFDSLLSECLTEVRPPVRCAGIRVPGLRFQLDGPAIFRSSRTCASKADLPAPVRDNQVIWRASLRSEDAALPEET